MASAQTDQQVRVEQRESLHQSEHLLQSLLYLAFRES
jgi:hypothetical protein